ncbi:hypothetical protein [Hymenobacter properus]|uniref:Uncharacterized protein n=1 Tax=Hymenobacter properus TaxID=2791026 RepID=A0A931BL24_9BACT|nr:hypothetical protein [Hymenobacter properus]MBF9143317.1 hypothetical protein [Hymenobacter properus]MBR7722127.1 hypothetical protein [Microvirga sp. SRT04]
MSPEQLNALSKWLMHLNQASIIVPMAMVWMRRKHFAPAVKLLSNYVYLSAFCSFGINFLYPSVFATNYWFLAGFNLGKTLLLGAVYYLVMESAPLRRVVLNTSLVAMLCVLSVFSYDTYAGVTCARLTQCAVLAGFAMLYLEQTIIRPALRRTWQDPIWLLSVGQLLYSAGTVTAFSFDYFSVTIYDQSSKALVSATLGLVFNVFLTLAFRRARRTAAKAATRPALAVQPARA